MTWDSGVRGAAKLNAVLRDEFELALLFRRIATLETDAPVSDSVEFFKQDLRELERKTVALFGLDVTEAQTPIDLIDGFIGEGYAIPYPEAIETIRHVARTEGILLDPTYTAKAMTGTLATIRAAGGVRAGASYWFIPEVEGYIGAGYDSTAVPIETLDPALMDAHKMSVSLGVRWQIIKYLALSFTATELIFFETSTKGKSALNRFQPPTRQPSGDGVYKQFFQLFNIYADVAF